MLIAQTNFKPVADVNSVKATFSQQLSATQTLTSDFTQIKQLKLLKEDITSKGQFFYKKANKVRIAYTTPYKYLVVLNNGQMSITDHYGKKTAVNSRNSKSLQSINKVMIDCMSGNIFNNNDFNVKVAKSTQEYWVQLFPKTSDLQSMFKKIDVYFSIGKLYINKMVITELNGDITTMNYTNVKANTSLNEQLFKTK